MKLFNAFFGTLTAGLIATTLALTAAAWIDGPDTHHTPVAAADTAILVQN